MPKNEIYLEIPVDRLNKIIVTKDKGYFLVQWVKTSAIAFLTEDEAIEYAESMKKKRT